MNRVKEIIKRLSEPSTWNAISVLTGVVGYNLPEWIAPYVMGIAAGGFILINAIWKRDSQSQ